MSTLQRPVPVCRAESGVVYLQQHRQEHVQQSAAVVAWRAGPFLLLLLPPAASLLHCPYHRPARRLQNTAVRHRTQHRGAQGLGLVGLGRGRRRGSGA